MAEQEKCALFFGQFLLERGVVSQEALDDALAFQEDSNRRIGEMAIEKGHLTPKQVEHIFADQRLLDDPFGAIALKLKYLSRRQLDDLLFTQDINSTHLGEALLLRGHITPEQFVAHLKAYNKMTRSREAEIHALLQGLADREIYEAVVQALDRTFARFVGKHARIGALHEAMPANVTFKAYTLEAQLLDQGRVTCVVGLAEEVAAIIPERLASGGGLDIEQPEDADLASHCREFFRIMARYFAHALEDAGLALSPELLVAGGADREALRGPVIEMATPAGPMYLAARVAA